MRDKEHRKVGQRIAAFATRQHGVVSRKQLRALGLTDAMIDRRLGCGALQSLYRGVFAVGHRSIDRCGLALAAVLACGDGAVASHSSAAELLGLWDRQPALIDVTSRSASGRKVQGIRWHHGGALADDEVTMLVGVPCTTVSRTLVDMAGLFGERTLRRLVEQATVLRALDVEAVDRVLARRRRRGAPKLRAILAPWRAVGELPRIRSRLEARVLAAVIEAGLPQPRCNVRMTIGGKRVEIDLLWEEQRLAIETDGEETHGTPIAFQEDRRRDQRLMAAGYRTARITWNQMEDEPEATIARLGRMLEVAA